MNTLENRPKPLQSHSTVVRKAGPLVTRSLVITGPKNLGSSQSCAKRGINKW